MENNESSKISILLIIFEINIHFIIINYKNLHKENSVKSTIVIKSHNS
jgi:hypothetical protein